MDNSTRLYRLDFEIHRDCKIENWIGFTLAKNATEAKQKARTNFKLKNYMFHLEAHRHTNLEPITTWKNNEYEPNDLIDRFVCTDFRVWRVRR